MDTPRVLVTTAQGIATFYLDVLAPSESFSVSFSALVSNDVSFTSTVDTALSFEYKKHPSDLTAVVMQLAEDDFTLSQPTFSISSISSSESETLETPTVDLIVGEHMQIQYSLQLPEGTNPVNLTFFIPNSALSITSVVIVSIGSSFDTATMNLEIGESLIPASQSVGANVVSEVDFGNAVLNVPDGSSNMNDVIAVWVTYLFDDTLSAHFERANTMQDIHAYMNGAQVDSLTVRLLEPLVFFQEVNSLSDIDAGDNLVQSFALGYEADSAIAHHVTVNITLAPGLSLTETIVACQFPKSSGFEEGVLNFDSCQSRGAVSLVAQVIQSDDWLSVYVDNIDEDYVLQIQVNAVVDQMIIAGSSIFHLVEVSYLSLPTIEAPSLARSYLLTDMISVEIRPIEFGITVTSSDAFTAGSVLTIGEEANALIVISVPEGSSPLALRIDLPLDTTFLNVAVQSVGSLSLSVPSPSAEVLDIDGRKRIVLDFGDMSNAFDNVESDGDLLKVNMV
jgi:hypothetical protein